MVRNKKKEITMLIIGILILITLIVGATYAFFKAQTGNAAYFDINTTTGTTDNLTFLTDDGIKLDVTAANLGKNGNDISKSSIAKARLIANDTTNSAEAKYNVYLLIEENELEYSSYKKGADVKTFTNKEEKNKTNLEGYEGISELILGVEKNNKEYTLDDRLNVTAGGYDITEAEGLYAIAEDVIIKAEGEKGTIATAEDEWEITITYKNLNYNQQLNTGRKLTGKLIITTEYLLHKITTINDLVDLSNEVNNGDTKEGQYYVLTKDLDFNNINDYRANSEELKNTLTDPNGEGFTPIGNSESNSFQGNFDGGSKNNQHRIANLFISSSRAYNALFGYIKNAKIYNTIVSGNVNISIFDGAGIVSYMVSSMLNNCINEVNVTSSFGYHLIGGIVALASGDENIIKNSINKGNITGAGYNGGIVGGQENGTLTIENCANEGVIYGKIGQSSGGIIGTAYKQSNTLFAKKLIINNCHNKGEIKSDVAYNLGGILGWNKEQNIEIIINNSYNEGNITISKANTASEVSAGGIMGLNQGQLTINNSKNSGEIKDERDSLKNTYFGGIVGFINNSSKSVITNSLNQGKVTNSYWGGGIVGYTSNSTAIIDRSFNEENIETEFSGNVDLGGIVGVCHYNCKLTILNSYNLGSIICTRSNSTSGILSVIDGSSQAYILNSFNIGNIESQTAASGIITAWSTEPLKLYLNNVYNLGTVNATNKYGINYVRSANVTDKYAYNAYYKSGVDASNINLSATAMDELSMKSQSFVEILNNNIVNDTTISENGINRSLKDIDPVLEGYTLSRWKWGINGYPTLDF